MKLVKASAIQNLLRQHDAWATRFAHEAGCGDEGRILLTDTRFEDFEARGLDLSCMLLSRCDFSKSRFFNCDLSRAQYLDCYLRDCLFVECEMFKMELNGSDCTGTTFRGCNLARSEMLGVDLSDSRLERCDLSWSSLDRLDLEGTVFTACDFLSARMGSGTRRAIERLIQRSNVTDHP